MPTKLGVLRDLHIVDSTIGLLLGDALPDDLENLLVLYPIDIWRRRKIAHRISCLADQQQNWGYVWDRLPYDSPLRAKMIDRYDRFLVQSRAQPPEEWVFDDWLQVYTLALPGSRLERRSRREIVHTARTYLESREAYLCLDEGSAEESAALEAMARFASTIPQLEECWQYARFSYLVSATVLERLVAAQLTIPSRT